VRRRPVEWAEWVGLGVLINRVADKVGVGWWWGCSIVMCESRGDCCDSVVISVKR
jgi:hypothetical protein